MRSDGASFGSSTPSSTIDISDPVTSPDISLWAERCPVFFLLGAMWLMWTITG